ncbi:uncharacterized protein PRCAT00001248001 [Priceomyces carsonii]|uniref:uncharacterized protein n=1 Tax=Priceomyces carsonii TaxID=28549 RepID=UPI002EDB2DB9|nr:unnamed protein product [Priceomyces carsonii]
MSFFMGNSSQYSYLNVDEEKMKLAEVQYDAMTATFNKVLETCESKCIGHEYGESELNTGELSCVDRCVIKYVTANYTVGTSLQEKGFSPYNSMPEYNKIKNMIKTRENNT